MANPKKQRKPCLICGKEPARSYYKYCSNLCQRKFEYDEIVKKWKAGETSGLNTIGLVSAAVKKYLRDKYANKCSICGWNKVNQTTGLVPLVADHIDGDWRNNREENLRLICPNCDALLPTFSALNKGKGRTNRTLSKRAKEAKVFLKNRPK